MKLQTIKSYAHSVLDSIFRMAIRHFADHRPVDVILKYIDHHSILTAEKTNTKRKRLFLEMNQPNKQCEHFGGPEKCVHRYKSLHSFDRYSKYRTAAKGENIRKNGKQTQNERVNSGSYQINRFGESVQFKRSSRNKHRNNGTGTNNAVAREHKPPFKSP